MSDASRAGKCWYLIYAKPRQEKTAVDNLLRQAYEVYFPQIRVTRNRNSVRKVTIEPLFPRYLFIRLDAHTDNWAPIRSTMGVTALVRFGGYAAAVDDVVNNARPRFADVTSAAAATALALPCGTNSC